MNLVTPKAAQLSVTTFMMIVMDLVTPKAAQQNVAKFIMIVMTWVTQKVQNLQKNAYENN